MTNASSLIVSTLSVLLALPVAAAPAVFIDRHAPCNLFQPGEDVRFNVRLKELPAQPAEAKALVTDYSGKEVLNKSFTFGGAGSTIDLGKLPRGYYELKLNFPGAPEQKATFGVMEFINRDAAQARAGNYVFGVKWWGGVPDQREAAAAISKLGLQWTRVIQNQGAPFTTRDMLTDYPINAVIKVERFPKELYDSEKYGPLDEWEKKYGRGAWTLKTLPKKEAYQAYLRQQLKDNVPADQKVFEIWNEPWDKMSPEDFATLSGWISEVVLQERPGAILGPNLLGTTSPYEYDARVIKAGGLKGMKMVALHPYAAANDRAWLRGYRKWLKEQTGTDMEIYITEYGSHSTPAGPNKRSEEDQARRIVLQSLALYAEGAKALIPHWLGQSERDPSYIEDWFGFVRKNEQPKPALLAHANCARLIDGSRYEGDLWYGPRVGAMLFDKAGTHTLALWTAGDPNQPVPAKEIEVQPGVKEVTLVDIVGQEQKLPVTNGKLKVTLTESPIYLVGVSPALAKGASAALRPDRFPQPEKAVRVLRAASRFKTRPTLDGNFDDWKGVPQIGMINPKVAGADASGFASIGWDETNLYLGVDMRDNEMLNTKPRAKLYQQDSIELFLSTEPRDAGSGFGPRDAQFFLTPTSGEGKPILGRVTDREAGVVTDVEGGQIFAGVTNKGDRGWALEAAIPWSALNFTPKPGAKLALELRVNDADTSHERFKLDAADLTGPLSVSDPSSWSFLELKE